MSSTVIAFYPGGGGNRYLRYLSGQEYSQSAITYDSYNATQKFEHRYLLQDKINTSENIILTHCMNCDRIQQIVGPCEVIFIKSDFKKSILREWKLSGFDRYKQKFKFDYESFMVESYQKIKDDSWPECNNYNEFENLPDCHKQEVYEKSKKFCNLDELISAWECICWHKDYYEKYPINTKNCKIIEIDKESTSFAEVIRKELESYNSKIFDFCWDIFNSNGNNAPIVDLYIQNIF